MERRAGRRRAAWLRAAAVTGLVAAAAALPLLPGAPGGQPAAAAALDRFASCEELRGWYADQAGELVRRLSLGAGTGAELGRPGVDPGIVAGNSAVAGGPRAVDDGPGRSTTGPAIGAGATGTNLQEAGVDEPDLVKTDGSLVLTVTGRTLHVVDVTGDRPRRLAKLELPEGDAAELLLVGHRVVVLGTRWPLAAPMSDLTVTSDAPVTLDGPVGSSSRPALAAPTAVLTVVDLARPDAPRVLTVEEVDGSVLAAREHAGTVRAVVQTVRVLPTEARTAQDWLPSRTVRDAAGDVVRREPLLDCTQVHHPAYGAGAATLSVITLDVSGTAPGVVDAVAVAADGEHVYASADRLYVATTRGGWWRPVPLEPTAGLATADVAVDPVTTELHAFDITGADRTRYTSSGRVDGWLLGRWAISEFDGLLRVATTRTPRSAADESLLAPGGTGGSGRPAGAGGTDSAVTVLRESGRRLDVVGAVAGLGEGEQIRAVRWFGDLAVVVTFRQTDPLYTVDLSDPEDPVLAGELKVPGYSAYLHPVGDGVLLGVGQDATADGTVLGAQVSSFDLSDPAAPVRRDRVDLGRGWSPVEGDARAFTYLPGLRLAVVPVNDERGAVWGLRVAPDGSLTTAGRWRLDGGWVERAVPVEGDRLAVLSQGAQRRLGLLDADGMRPLGPGLVLDELSPTGGGSSPGSPGDSSPGRAPDVR